MEAPPTPPVALGRLLADGELGLRRLAGPAEAEVHGVHASEMADPSPYLLGGELLLTAGAGLAGAETDPDGGADAGLYVERLVRAGAAALGFGVTPVHESVPQALVDACTRHGLPLVEVPPATPFTAVGRAVWRLMAQARTRELRRVTDAQQSLAAAAARPDPVPTVLSRLASALGGRACLLAPATRTEAGAATAAGTGVPGGGVIRSAWAGAAGVEPGAEVRNALDALAQRVAPGPGSAATATDTLAGTHLAAYAVGGGQALALATPARAPGDHTIASVAAVLLTLLTASRPAGTEAAALTRLLLDNDPADALAPGPWYVVRARGGGDPQALAAALGTVLLDAHGNGNGDEDRDGDGDGDGDGDRDGVRLITDREPTPQPGWTLGVSAPAAPDGLATAAAQAQRALDRAEAARTPLVRHTAGGLDSLLDPAEARAHAEALLAPLGTAHRETLRAWLAHHGSWDRTAAALAVHRNTVRQRIARAATLLGRDLDDPDTRMELWFALRRLPGAGQR
ncbi:PucR family transcriptional regulator [Streptomyces sp. NBC_01294]|uniref:PucR family transcriptional regulator n=1 Tax=Streptomyces sp. NBC_01294 TaxID=2903815 RepID=UPI002DDA47BB|nr:PucR family transcriptional regulator [Streptomyces sp. NBC_01294]WRZ59221.1 PucR family transcriptional regulator [Streptomyces sp. NBC_01294]